MTARSEKQMHSFILIAYDNPINCYYFRGNYTDFKLVFDLSSVQDPQQSCLCFGIDKNAPFVIQLFSSNPQMQSCTTINQKRMFAAAFEKSC